MSCCKRQNFGKKTINTHNFNQPISLVERVQGELSPGSIEPSENFTELFKLYSKVLTLAGVSRFSGINIDKRATHFFMTPFFSALENLDSNNIFINYKDKNYRVLGDTNKDEDDYYVVFQATERGDDSLEASEV
jgi:hypothetical protein